MQISFARGIRLVIPILLIALAIGCNPDQEKIKKIQELALKIDTLELRLKNPVCPGPFDPKKHHKQSFGANGGRRLVELCLNVNFQGTEYDSVTVRVSAVNDAGKSSRFAEITFSKFVKSAKVNFLEKKKFDLIFKSIWYKGGAPAEGDWCPMSAACPVTGPYKCNNLSTPVSTVKTNAAGSSTATVSMDEQ